MHLLAQLLRLFRLDEFPNFTKPIDPSLYLHRFVDRLKLGDKKVVRTRKVNKLMATVLLLKRWRLLALSCVNRKAGHELLAAILNDCMFLLARALSDFTGSL
jgi:hypothetical protein